MKLLVTGAAKFSEQQLDIFKNNLGLELVFQQDERGEAETDFSQVDAAVLNGLFLYHDIEEFEKLKFVQLTSAGLDKVPLEKIKEKGISLHNARGVYSIPMAEFAVAGVLSVYKNLNHFFENKKSHIWQKDRRIKELCSNKVVIVGCGSVGTECAKRFKAFGTEIIGVDLFKPADEVYDLFFDINNIDKALSISDVVVITLPLTEKTRGMFDGKLLSECKSGAVIVNISRGSVLKEDALAEYIDKAHLSGAVLDVFENEPLDESSRLWDMDNVFITPHNSFVSPNNSDRLFNLCFNNLKDFMKGETE